MGMHMQEVGTQQSELRSLTIGLTMKTASPGVWTTKEPAKPEVGHSGVFRLLPMTTGPANNRKVSTPPTINFGKWGT